MKSPGKEYQRQLREEIKRLRKKILHHESETRSLKEIIASTMHEIREFSAVISEKSYRLSKNGSIPEPEKDTVNNIFYTSGMLSARLSFTDIETNPNLVKSKVRSPAGIYKKFDKARYLLNSYAKEEGVTISLQGQSNFEINALQAFDMVPFVILHNAIKYSPESYEVKVIFKETPNEHLNVQIISYGPPVPDGESSRLFEKGFRGSNSTRHEGSGLGLNLAKRVCDIHAISIKLSRGNILPHTFGGQSFEEFIVEINIEK